MSFNYYGQESAGRIEEVLSSKAGRLVERKAAFRTSSRIDVARLYEPAHHDMPYKEKLGLPGEYPFTRGVQPNMYRSKLWTMRQYAGFGSANETNRRFKFLLRKGQTGLSCAFDLPTQIGLDSDAPLAAGEVGKVGVAVDSLLDMEQLFSGIPLDSISTSMTINAPATVILAMYIAVAEKQGIHLDALSGTVQNDILKEYVARGTYIFPPDASMRLTTDLLTYCTAFMPKFKAISVSGYHMREAGATAVQELAFTIAHGMAYVQAARETGVDIDRLAPQLSFFFAVHNHLFEEVAKFRAARRMWAKLMRERFKARDPRSWQFRVHAQTAGSTLTAAQPDNNVARVTLQALAAVLGGTQSLHTNAKDEALALPTEESVQTALATQQILAYESGVTDTVDPLAGSYFVEHLTDQLERHAWDYIDNIEKRGGALSAVEQGYLQEEIRREAYRSHRRVEESEDIVVGVNRFAEAAERKITLHRAAPRLERQQHIKLQQLRRTRNNTAVRNALDRLQRSAQGDDNVMPLIIEAVKCYATVGEICDTLRAVFGVYEPS